MTQSNQRRRRSIIVVSAIVVLLVVGVIAVLLGTRKTTATPSVPAGRFTAYVGQGNPSGVHPKSRSCSAPRSASRPDVLGQRDWNGITDDETVIDRWKGSGYRMIWSVPMLPESGGASLPAGGATGAYNMYFSQLARNPVAAGMGDSYLRLGWGVQSVAIPWYPAGQSSYFVEYWRQIVSTMRTVPGANFSFVWNPSRGDNGPKDKAMGNFADYYPGDAYVDVIGMDVYDTSWNHYPGESAEFRDHADPGVGAWTGSLEIFADKHGKPLAIPELGLGPFLGSASRRWKTLHR